MCGSYIMYCIFYTNEVWKFSPITSPRGMGEIPHPSTQIWGIFPQVSYTPLAIYKQCAVDFFVPVGIAIAYREDTMRYEIEGAIEWFTALTIVAGLTWILCMF